MGNAAARKKISFTNLKVKMLLVQNHYPKIANKYLYSYTSRPLMLGKRVN